MYKIIRYLLIVCVLYSTDTIFPQDKDIGIETSKTTSNGLIVSKIIVKLKSEGNLYVKDESKVNQVLNAFAIGTGSAYEINVFDFAVSKLKNLDFIQTADYKLYSQGFSDNLTLVIEVCLVLKDKKKEDEAKGIFAKGGGLDDFPVLIENNNSKFSFIMTGGAGTFTDFDAFFQHGDEFTKGNPTATDPAGPGYASWLELSYELGIGGVMQLWNQPVYPYFGLSGLLTGMTGQDLYSNVTRGFSDFEDAYLGFVYRNTDNGFLANFSAGRQNYQLNDGLLFSRISGSANAGQRASLFLSARTTFEKSVLLNLKYKKITLDGAFLEPEELDFAPKNTQFLIGSLDYNNNSSVEAGISYISIINSGAKYANVQGIDMTKEGLYAINPKLWLNSVLGNTEIKLRSEFVYEGNRNFDMGAYAFYASVGYLFEKLSLSPELTYRYSYMSGDDSSTVMYERFDPLLTGGLGNWIQGLNFRKVIGNGNIGAHRIQLDILPKQNMLLSIDYFYLWAPELFNVGGLPPLSILADKYIGQELTLTYKYFISDRFTLLSIFSTAFPGAGIKKAFSGSTNPWTTVQLALFMHFL